MPGVYSEAQVTAYIQQFRERFKAIETQLSLISEKLAVPYENPNDAEVPDEVRELARAGKRLDAVKRYPQPHRRKPRCCPGGRFEALDLGAHTAVW